MAEEEVLNEQIVSSKGDKSGVSPLIPVIVSVVASVIIIVLLFSMMGKTNQINGLNTQMEDIKKSIEIGRAQDEQLTTIDKCEKVFDLTPSKPLVVNLADGHYISTKVSVCIDEKKVTEEQLKGQVAPLVYIVQSSLMRLKKCEIFPESKDCAGSTPEPAAKSEGGLGELGGQSEADSTKFPDANLNKIRGKLRADLNRNFDFVLDVYPYEFVVD